MLKSITEGAVRLGYTIYGKAVKHSPEILVGMGLASMVAGAIVACEKTTQAEAIIKETKARLYIIHEAETREDVEYSETEKRQDLVTVYARAGVRMAKNYAVAGGLMLVGGAAILVAFKIMSNRLGAATATIGGLQAQIATMLARAENKWGQEGVDYLKTGREMKDIPVNVVDEKTGEVKQVTENKPVFDGDIDVFSRWFDDRNVNWVNCGINNQSFLRSIETALNRQLRREGFVFLNDAYAMLGYPRVPQGQAVGWLKNPKPGMGDGEIRLGLNDGFRRDVRDFQNGYEKVLLLTFNIDKEPIWDKIGTHNKKYMDD